MDYEHQTIISESISHAATMVQHTAQAMLTEYERPCVIFKPTPSMDGNMYCVLFGENLQEGVAGFGKTMAEAMYDFDCNWYGRENPSRKKQENPND